MNREKTIEESLLKKHAGNVHDSKGASDVIALLKGRFERIIKIVADGGYRGELIEKTKTTFGWILEIVLRSDHSSKFTVIPKDGLSKERLPRLKATEGLVKTSSFELTQAWL